MIVNKDMTVQYYMKHITHNSLATNAIFSTEMPPRPVDSDLLRSKVTFGFVSARVSIISTSIGSNNHTNNSANNESHATRTIVFSFSFFFLLRTKSMWLKQVHLDEIIDKQSNSLIQPVL